MPRLTAGFRRRAEFFCSVGPALLVLVFASMRIASAQPAAPPVAQPGLNLPAGYASQLLQPQWRASFPYRSAFGSLCSLAPLACALIDPPFAFNARLELFLRPSAPDGSTSLLLPFSASVPLFGRAEVGLGSCYTGFWNPNPDQDKASASPPADRPSGLCPFWFAGKLLLFPWFRDPHVHPALAIEYQGEYQAGPFGGLNQLGLPGPLSKVSLAYRHPVGRLELAGAASVLVDHTTRAGTVQFGGHVGYRLPVGEHFRLFGQALAQLPSFGPMLREDKSGSMPNLTPPVAGTLAVGAQQRADFGFGVGLSLMVTKSELETRVDVLLRLLSFELGPHIKPLIAAKPTPEELPKVEAKLEQPPVSSSLCPVGTEQTLGCHPASPPRPVYERLPGGPCYLYSPDGSEQLEMGHIDSTGHFCDWDALHLPLGAVLPFESPDTPPVSQQSASGPGPASADVARPHGHRAIGKKSSRPLVALPAARPASAAAPAHASGADAGVRLTQCTPPPLLWRRGISPIVQGFADGAMEACEHTEQIYKLIKEHGPLVVLPRPQDMVDWWQETKKECLDRIGPCIREKAQRARGELDRFRHLSWEQKQYELGKAGFQAVEEAVINAALPGGGVAGTGVRAAEHAAEEQFVKTAARKLEKEAAERAGAAAAGRGTKEAVEAEVKHAAETEAQRAAQARAAAGGGGRGANHLKLNPDAEGPHSTFKTDPQGRVTGHAEWQPNPRNPAGMDQVKRVDTQHANSHTHHNNVTKEEVPTPHVHEKSTPGGVRPARPDELPR